jgi:hypothetical protein
MKFGQRMQSVQSAALGYYDGGIVSCFDFRSFYKHPYSSICACRFGEIMPVMVFSA